MTNFGPDSKGMFLARMGEEIQNLLISNQPSTPASFLAEVIAYLKAVTTLQERNKGAFPVAVCEKNKNSMD